MLVGAMTAHRDAVVELAEDLMGELIRKNRRLEAMEYAAETILNEDSVSTGDEYCDVHEWLMSATDAVEETMRRGVEGRELMKLLEGGIDDDEINIGRLILDDERCDCGAFRGKQRLCMECEAEEEEAAESV
jgi:hypothetical protein